MPSEEYALLIYGLCQATFVLAWTEIYILRLGYFVKVMHACAGVYM